MKVGIEPSSNSKTLLSYEGGITDTSISNLLALAEHKIKQEGLTKSTERRLFKILVETLQNAYWHLDNSSDQKDDGIKFSLSRDNYLYTVSSGNYVSRTEEGILRTLLDRFNRMSLSELKNYYLRKLSKGQLSPNGGAGLGFVDIIRKSGKKISYSFKPVNKDYSYFSLQVKVSA
jgi:hypothetical protein